MAKMNPDMVANNLVPFRPVHPGAILKEELKSRRLTQRGFARQMGVPVSQLNEILNGKRPLSAEYALMVEALLDISAVPLLRMQTDYDLQTAKENINLIEKLKGLASAAAAL